MTTIIYSALMNLAKAIALTKATSVKLRLGWPLLWAMIFDVALIAALLRYAIG